VPERLPILDLRRAVFDTRFDELSSHQVFGFVFLRTSAAASS
jgi:hypothetical protein